MCLVQMQLKIQYLYLVNDIFLSLQFSQVRTGASNLKQQGLLLTYILTFPVVYALPFYAA